MATQDDITRLNFQHPYVRPIDRRDLDDLCPVSSVDPRPSLWDMAGYEVAPLRVPTLEALEHPPASVGTEIPGSTSWVTI